MRESSHNPWEGLYNLAISVSNSSKARNTNLVFPVVSDIEILAKIATLNRPQCAFWLPQIEIMFPAYRVPFRYTKRRFWCVSNGPCSPYIASIDPKSTCSWKTASYVDEFILKIYQIILVLSTKMVLKIWINRILMAENENNCFSIIVFNNLMDIWVFANAQSPMFRSLIKTLLYTFLIYSVFVLFDTFAWHAFCIFNRRVKSRAIDHF